MFMVYGLLALHNSRTVSTLYWHFCINVAGAESFSGAWNENEKKVEIIKEMTSRDDWKTMHAWLGLSALI